MTARAADELEVMVAGQGGDGSLTLVGLLGDLLGRRGLHLYRARNVGSRVKGGHAAAFLRASAEQHGCLGDAVDLLVAFDDEALAQGGPRLAGDGVVVYDCSDGPAPREALPPGATVVEVPFGRLAVRDLRRDLYKNSLAFGVAARLVGVDDDEAAGALRRSLARLPAHLVEANLRALAHGFEHAAGAAFELPRLAPDGERVLMTGNEALALGFLVGGGRFFAGYPITPATEILEWLERELPAFGGAVVQAEDELAAVNLAIGAALAGVRAMTASSGPGIALMQEGISQLGSAEIGLVVVDCQRAGPSTGMPTKPEQSDLGMLFHGGNGDFPRIVLAASDPADAFELGALAPSLAERLQGPVVVALDQVVAQDAATVPRPDPGSVRIDRGALLTQAGLSALAEYCRYALTGDGASPWAALGAVGGQHLVTGNERDEWGRVSAAPANRVRMVDKRARKLEALLGELPRARQGGDPAAEVGLVGFGMEAPVVAEAARRLAAAGLPVRTLQPRTLWPVLEDVLGFARECRRVHVVEHNATGQYAHALAAAGAPRERLAPLLRYDGVPWRPGELAAAVLAAQEGR